MTEQGTTFAVDADLLAKARELSPEDLFMPNAEDLKRAFDAGTPVRNGVPIRAHRKVGMGDVYWAADLRSPGHWLGRFEYDDMHWHFHSIAGVLLAWVPRLGVQTVSSDADAIVVSRVILSMALANTDEMRHSKLGGAYRERAAKAISKIKDAEMRGAVAVHVDVWPMGKIIESNEEGILAEGIGDDPQWRVLVVTCPSTGRQYSHAVPLGMRTAKEARRWIMGLEKGDPDPKIET